MKLRFKNGNMEMWFGVERICVETSRFKERRRHMQADELITRMDARNGSTT